MGFFRNKKKNRSPSNSRTTVTTPSNDDPVSDSKKKKLFWNQAQSRSTSNSRNSVADPSGEDPVSKIAPEVESSDEKMFFSVLTEAPVSVSSNKALFNKKVNYNHEESVSESLSVPDVISSESCSGDLGVEIDNSIASESPKEVVETNHDLSNPAPEQIVVDEERKKLPLSPSSIISGRFGFGRKASKKRNPSTISTSSTDKYSIDESTEDDKNEPKTDISKDYVNDEVVLTDNQKREDSNLNEVNYDMNPTLLYKFIEYKEWGEAIERCHTAPKEASTWVFRFEEHDDDGLFDGDTEGRSIRWKMLPIHVAIIFKAPLKLIKAIVKAYPESIMSPDDRKMLPIHLCCRAITDMEVAKYLLQQDNKSLVATDYKGRDPLQILVDCCEKLETQNNQDDSQVELKQRYFLIKLIKNMLQPMDQNDRITSDINASKNCNQETEEQPGKSISASNSKSYSHERKQGYSDSISGSNSLTFMDSSKDVEGSRYNNLRLESVQTVSTDDDEDDAESTFDDENSLGTDSLLGKQDKMFKPSTSRDNSNVTLRKPLIDKSKGMRDTMKVSKTKSPSSQRKKAEEHLREIVPKYQRKKSYIKREKKLVQQVDYDNKPTLLIRLIEKKLWSQTISRCMENPKEASIWMCRLQKNKYSDRDDKEISWKILPIHSAIVLHAPANVIDALVDAYPQGLRKGDDRNMLPLHMAFRLGASLDSTAIIVDAYPDGLKKKDAKGHTPMHILKAYRSKYKKDKDKGKLSKALIDRNRRNLIKFYLGGRRYGSDDDATLASYDSESYSDESDYSNDSTIFDDERSYDEVNYNHLFHDNMFSDCGKLTAKGITAVPQIMRETMNCTTHY